MGWLRQQWRRFWFDPVSPTNLGVCRMLFFAAFFLYYLPRDFSAWAEVSRAFWMPISLFKILSVPVLSGHALALVQAIWKVTLGLSCIGLFTRLSTAISFLLGSYLLALPHNFGKVHHNDAIVVLILGIMALSRCGDGWSVDRLIRTGRDGIVPSERDRMRSGEYAWPLRLVWVLMSLIFFGSGMSKVGRSGLEWIASDNLAILLVRHNYSHTPWTPWGFEVAQHAWLSRLLAAATVVCEAGYPLALISRVARWIVVPGMFLIQLGILLLMDVEFSEFLICNLFWVPWDRIGRPLVRWYRGGRTYAVLFDGSCGLCRRTVALMQGLDVMNRVDFHDVWNDWPTVASRFPRLDRSACLQQMHVVTPDLKVLTDFEAYRAIAKVAPLGWPVLPLLYLPGVPSIGRWIYALVASRRHAGGCPLPPGGGAPEARLNQREGGGGREASREEARNALEQH